LSTRTIRSETLTKIVVEKPTELDLAKILNKVTQKTMDRALKKVKECILRLYSTLSCGINTIVQQA